MHIVCVQNWGLNFAYSSEEGLSLARDEIFSELDRIIVLILLESRFNSVFCGLHNV